MKEEKLLRVTNDLRKRLFETYDLHVMSDDMLEDTIEHMIGDVFQKGQYYA